VNHSDNQGKLLGKSN